MHSDGVRQAADGMPNQLVARQCEQVFAATNGETGIEAVGVAVPGLVKKGVVEEAASTLT